MAFCKLFACGEKVVFERRLSYPENCPSCGRKLSEFRTYLEDDPALIDLLEKKDNSLTIESNIEQDTILGYSNHDNRYVLRLFNGKEIPIPPEGCIVGRTEVGAEELAEFPSVSRQHIRIVLKRAGVFIEDVSRYGTLIDGQRMIKNTPVRVANGAKITLCNVETIFNTVEGAHE